jgi:hypothetical protein
VPADGTAGVDVAPVVAVDGAAGVEMNPDVAARITKKVLGEDLHPEVAARLAEVLSRIEPFRHEWFVGAYKGMVPLFFAPEFSHIFVRDIFFRQAIFDPENFHGSKLICDLDRPPLKIRTKNFFSASTKLAIHNSGNGL